MVSGTNCDSLSSWLQQDFDVSTASPLGSLPGAPPGVPPDVLIGHGTFTGTSDLLHLRDPQTGQSMVEFLKVLGPRYVYVTGHSLGGTLAPVLFAYLNTLTCGGGPTTRQALWTFAGLTPGGTGFNAYFNAVLPDSQGFQWRIQNSLDVAPLCWWSLSEIEKIYLPYDLHWNAIERHLITDLFGQAAKAAIGYSHPQPGVVLAGSFDRRFVDREMWAGQALHQHHPATYQALVKARYPGALRHGSPRAASPGRLLSVVRRKFLASFSAMARSPERGLAVAATQGERTPASPQSALPGDRRRAAAARRPTIAHWLCVLPLELRVVHHGHDWLQ